MTSPFHAIQALIISDGGISVADHSAVFIRRSGIPIYVVRAHSDLDSVHESRAAFYVSNLVCSGKLLPGTHVLDGTFSVKITENEYDNKRYFEIVLDPIDVNIPELCHVSTIIDVTPYDEYLLSPSRFIKELHDNGGDDHHLAHLSTTIEFQGIQRTYHIYVNRSLCTSTHDDIIKSAIGYISDTDSYADSNFNSGLITLIIPHNS